MKPVRLGWGLLAFLCCMALRAQESFEVEVIPPDYVFHFAPRASAPGRPRLALALSGGGARGVGHIGILQGLDDDGYPVDYVVGTSAGALMGTLYACGYSGKEIQALFEGVDFGRAFLDPLLRNPGRTLEEEEAENGTLFTVQMEQGLPTVALGLRSGATIQRTLEGLVARGAYFSGGDFDNLKMPLRILATNLETGQGRLFQKGDLVETLRASMAVPGGFRPVLIEGQQYVDGALAENLPVLAAREAFQPDVVLAVDVSTPMAKERVSNVFSLAARSLDLVIEGRQRDSRAGASVLVQPELRNVQFTDYGKQLPEIVADSRKSFDEKEPELRAKMLASGGDRTPLPIARIAFAQVPPAQVQEAVRTLLPEGKPIQRWSILAMLQQVLVHGWARDARARLEDEDGSKVLKIQLVPFEPVKALRVEGTQKWGDAILADLRGALPVGEPFNPERFGAILGRWVHRLVMGGAPLVDVRGSGFERETGTVRVVVKEPVLKTLEVRDGSPTGARYLREAATPMLGLPLRTTRLREFVALAEQRLHLAELRYQLKPLPDGCELVLVPIRHLEHNVDVSLGYESTLGWMAGFRYQGWNFGAFGAELELAGAVNERQKDLSLAIRRPFATFPGVGLEARAAFSEQRLESRFSFASPELPDPLRDARVKVVDLALGASYRFGYLEQGKAGLFLDQHRATFRQGSLDRLRTDRALELRAEWDNFDRPTFPREGLLLRGKYGFGRSEPGLAPDGAFRYGYLRARGLQPLGSEDSKTEFGLDLDLEWGYGKNLPVDRWWGMGGPSFLVGSDTQGLLAPNFAAARLGIPLRLNSPFGLSLQVIPRIDYCRMAAESSNLFRGFRAQGAGLVLRTMLAKFYVELAYGFLRVGQPGQDLGRPSGSFNALIGTKPFDLWSKGN